MKPMQKIKAELLCREELNDAYYLLKVRIPAPLCESFTPQAGQFVQLAAHTPSVLLRRPISIADYHPESGTLFLVIQEVGKASHYWRQLAPGAMLDLIAPLGKGFTLEHDFSGEHPILVGGGVGTAPLLLLAKQLKERGITSTILLGARTKSLLLFREQFATLGNLYCTTDDGSFEVSGRVTDHPVLTERFSALYTCGPLAMMKPVIAWAKGREIPCEASLENKMACGIGACLCCVEPTTRGNICCCTEGPVFNGNLLLWK